jgi:hypothetical protein
MPNDLTISAVGTPIALPNRVHSYQPAPAANLEPKVAGPPAPSPTLRYDAAVGILVIDFHNDAGQVTNSIPTQRQLDAYRSRVESGGPPATTVNAETPSPAAASSAIVA